VTPAVAEAATATLATGIAPADPKTVARPINAAAAIIVSFIFPILPVARGYGQNVGTGDFRRNARPVTIRSVLARWRSACFTHVQVRTKATKEPDTMEKFTTLTAVAAPLPMINVDTDMIIPKQFLKTIKRTGLGKDLFNEMRYLDDGSENPDFVLNKPAYRNAQILVSGENFGCGSSREHAPWAIVDFGIRCIIAPSFADIFYNNTFKNGILPIVLPPEDVEKLMDDANRGANAIVTIDLENQTITGPDGGEISFEIDPFKKHCLLNGLDEIGLSLEKEQSITDFEAKRRVATPWLDAAAG
jgi:3-isopropylmalate/(R)-2-methylmalate dehydratase small subunit